MGIALYARWPEQTEQERRANARHGVGVIYEGYNSGGGPYATRALSPESFDENLQGEMSVIGPPVPAAALWQRLPEAMRLAIAREQRSDPNEDCTTSCRALLEFVTFCHAAERRLGHPCSIYASW